MAKAEYGLQMYSLRDITKENLKDSLKKVVEMGYKYIEFAGFFGNSAEDVKSWLDEYGLICSGAHTGAAPLAADVIDETIAYHKAIGCKNLIIPGMDWSTPEKLEENISLMNYAQKKLAEQGIALGYHNHSAEFFTTDYGKVVMDEIINRTTIALEIDTFWAFNAGVDPVSYCDSLKDRIRVIHLKDGIPVSPANRSFSHCHDGAIDKSIGLGTAPIKEVRAWALQNDVLMGIESEGLDPTGPEEVQRCIDYLRTLDS